MKFINTKIGQKLKLIYDYYSELKIVFSGSSVLDINKGVSDLARKFRTFVRVLDGLSASSPGRHPALHLLPVACTFPAFNLILLR